MSVGLGVPSILLFVWHVTAYSFVSCMHFFIQFPITTFPSRVVQIEMYMFLSSTNICFIANTTATVSPVYT